MEQKLFDLILNTESMDDEERWYWFDIYKEMTEEQIERLYDILEEEKIKLEKINKI
jgi:hypothetical protein